MNELQRGQKMKEYITKAHDDPKHLDEITKAFIPYFNDNDKVALIMALLNEIEKTDKNGKKRQTTIETFWAIRF